MSAFPTLTDECYHRCCRLLLPGGNVNVQTSEFTKAAEILYKMTIKVK